MISRYDSKYEPPQILRGPDFRSPIRILLFGVLGFRLPGFVGVLISGFVGFLMLRMLFFNSLFNYGSVCMSLIFGYSDLLKAFTAVHAHE